MSYSKKLLITFICGLVGAIIFYMLSLPLPWILGSAFAIMILNAARPHTSEWPRWISDLGIMVVAFILGQSVTMDIARSMLKDLPWMVAAAALWVVLCFYVGRLFARITRIDFATGVLGTVPGGLTQMVLVAEDMKNADAGIVAIIQTGRLVVVLYTVPLLAAMFTQPDLIQYAVQTTQESIQTNQLPIIFTLLAAPFIPLSAWFARRLHIPGGEFLGPFILVSALTIVGVSWPLVAGPILSVAQLTIGIFIGTRVQPRALFTNKRLGPVALVTSAILVGFTAVTAWLLSVFTTDSVVTWFLALAPGGLGEVAVTALVLNADVAKVTAFQTFRLFFVLLAAPPILKLIIERKQRQSELNNKNRHSDGSI